MRSSKEIKDELRRLRRSERNYEKKLSRIKERIVTVKSELAEAINSGRQSIPGGNQFRADEEIKMYGIGFPGSVCGIFGNVVSDEGKCTGSGMRVQGIA